MRDPIEREDHFQLRIAAEVQERGQSAIINAGQIESWIYFQSSAEDAGLGQ